MRHSKIELVLMKCQIALNERKVDSRKYRNALQQKATYPGEYYIFCSSGRIAVVAYYNGLPIGVHLDLYASALVSGKIRIGYTEYNIRDTRNNAPASAADMLFTVTNGLLMFGGSRIEAIFPQSVH